MIDSRGTTGLLAAALFVSCGPAVRTAALGHAVANPMMQEFGVKAGSRLPLIYHADVPVAVYREATEIALSTEMPINCSRFFLAGQVIVVRFQMLCDGTPFLDGTLYAVINLNGRLVSPLVAMGSPLERCYIEDGGECMRWRYPPERSRQN